MHPYYLLYESTKPRIVMDTKEIRKHIKCLELQELRHKKELEIELSENKKEIRKTKKRIRELEKMAESFND